MKTNHALQIGDSMIQFIETYDIMDLPVGGMQINGQCSNVLDFVRGLRLKEEWLPYGYRLTHVLKYEDSQNMTAYLHRAK